jgi:hypothetical protein
VIEGDKIEPAEAKERKIEVIEISDSESEAEIEMEMPTVSDNKYLRSIPFLVKNNFIHTSSHCCYSTREMTKPGP